MKVLTVKQALTGLCMVTIIPATIFAYGGPKNNQGQQQPTAAIEACQGQDVGASVTFINRRGDQISATCTQLQNQLVAIPDNRACGNNKIGKKMASNKKDGMRGKKGMFGPDMFNMLNLTIEQQAQIDKLQVAQVRPNRDEMMAQRMKVKQAMLAEPFDEAALRSLLEVQNNNHTEMMVKRAKFQKQLFNILTPTQQKMLAQQRFHQMMKRPHHGPEGRPARDNDEVEGK
jgi:Spy/CpxP family protein refolding chaperone